MPPVPPPPLSPHAAAACAHSQAPLVPWTGSSLAALSHPDGVTTVSVNWAGTLLATGCVDGSVYVWSLTSFSTLAVLEHASPDDLGPWAAVRARAAPHRFARKIGAPTLTPDPSLTAPARLQVSSVRLAADLLISGNRGGQLKLWSLTDEGKHVATLMPFQSEDGDTPPAIQGLAASALDGVIAVAGNDQLVIYRPLQKK